MAIRFASSHVTGDFVTGRLEIDIAIDDEASGESTADQIFFEVPHDFRTHNDLVAAALMTLVGRSQKTITFNFPISERCASILRAHYELAEIGPIDSSLEPRRPGQHLGVNFSGGLDSTALLLLLQQAGAEFKLITSDYVGAFARERVGYERFPRAVTCRTDFRHRRYDRNGRFNYAVPLLFADYADLQGITPGYLFTDGPPLAIERLEQGQEAVIRRQERAVTAAGLEEVHVIRSLSTLGVLKINLETAPELLEVSFRASSLKRTEKYVAKATLIRWLCEQKGAPVPAYLQNLELPRDIPPLARSATTDLRVLFIAKHYGADFAGRLLAGLSEYDLSFLNDIRFDFMHKYNPEIAERIPAELRERCLAFFHQIGLKPYNERDWHELGIVRDFLLTVRADRPSVVGQTAAMDQHARAAPRPASIPTEPPVASSFDRRGRSRGSAQAQTRARAVKAAISFASSHVDGAAGVADGHLRVEIAREDPRAGQTVYDQISFTVPPDFHAHNDLVAAALMTLAAHRFQRVEFNFAISPRCASILRDYYRLDAVGPVDPALEPRRPGRHFALTFSGGLDSTAALILLKRVAPDAKVITSDYGQPYAREKIGYEQFPRDVTCATDFRDKGYERGGRFNFAVPLLFADYLDLRAVAAGHPLHHDYPLSIEPLDRGQEPLFRRQDLAITAGGLDELHLIRSITTLGCLKIMLSAPDKLEASFAAAGSPGGYKYVAKGLLVRWLYEQRGLPPPPFLDNLELPPPAPASLRAAGEMSALFMAKVFGKDVVARFAPRVARMDLSFLDELTFDFFGKYNPNLIGLLPTEIRNGVLSAFQEFDIYPYDERDWREFAIVRDVIDRMHQRPAPARRPLNHQSASNPPAIPELSLPGNDV